MPRHNSWRSSSALQFPLVISREHGNTGVSTYNAVLLAQLKRHTAGLQVSSSGGSSAAPRNQLLLAVRAPGQFG